MSDGKQLDLLGAPLETRAELAAEGTTVDPDAWIARQDCESARAHTIGVADVGQPLAPTLSDLASSILGADKLQELEDAGLVVGRANSIIPPGIDKKLQDAGLEIVSRSVFGAWCDKARAAESALRDLASIVEREVGGERWRVNLNAALERAWVLLGVPPDQRPACELNRVEPRPAPRRTGKTETKGDDDVDR